MQQNFIRTLLPESIYIFFFKSKISIPIVHPQIAVYKNNVVIVALLVRQLSCIVIY